MKVQELLMNIKSKEFKLETGLQVKKYLPIEVKRTVAQSIIYECTNEEFGLTKVDSVQRYMSYVKYMITTHTNLEYTDENYDALCSTKYGETTLLNAIMDCFGDDAKECSRILNLMTDDLVYENSIEFTFGRVLYKLNNALDSLAGTIQKKLDGFDLNGIMPKGVNAEQITNILSMFNNKI